MKKFFIVTLSILVIGAISAVFVYTRVYNKPHTDIYNTEADYIVSADEIIDDFKKDEKSANKKYLDKIVEVKGVLHNIDATKNQNVLTLRTGESLESVICNMDPQENDKISGLEKGQSVQVKGICTGFLLDVVIVRAVLEGEKL